jgi:hypothetical protein
LADHLDAGAGGALIAAVLVAALTGGAGVAALAAGGVGGIINADRAPTVGFDRMQRVLDGFLLFSNIDDLAVPYRTFHLKRERDGVALKAMASGNVARAALKSAGNPFIFDDFDVARRGIVDPGADRVAMTPIEDTCKLFPGSRIIAINVTGSPAIYTRDLSCSVIEVRVDTGKVNARAVLQLGGAFNDAVAAGLTSTTQALAASGTLSTPTKSPLQHRTAHAAAMRYCERQRIIRERDRPTSLYKLGIWTALGGSLAPGCPKLTAKPQL